MISFLLMLNCSTFDSEAELIKIKKSLK